MYKCIIESYMILFLVVNYFLTDICFNIDNCMETIKLPLTLHHFERHVDHHRQHNTRLKLESSVEHNGKSTTIEKTSYNIINHCYITLHL